MISIKRQAISKRQGFYDAMNNNNSVRLVRELEGQCKLLISFSDTPQSMLSRLCNGYRNSKIDCSYLTCLFYFRQFFSLWSYNLAYVE